MIVRLLPLAALLLAACRPAAETPAATSAPARQLPVYRVATDTTYPPFEFTDHRGDIMGLDIDLLNAIARHQGFTVQYTHHGWAGMFGLLESGEADILASAIAITEESKQAADLSEPYFQTPYRAVSLAPEALNNWKQRRISAGRNEDTITDLQEEYGVAEHHIQATNTVYLALTDLVKQHAEVSVGDAAVLQYYMDSPTFTGYRFHSKLLQSADPETDKLVFAVKKGNRVLLDKINAGLHALKQSGELNRILKKWRQTPPQETTP